MTTIILGVIAFLVLLVVLFATGKKKAPSRPTNELPAPSVAVRSLVDEKKIIDAIKLYRQETHSSLYEAKQMIDSIRG